MGEKSEAIVESVLAVDPAAVESLIEQRQLGDKIKRLRLRKSMGLVELGEKTGLSASFLSQLETGRVVPTIRNLARVAMVFGKDISYFFQADREALFRISRRKDRVRLPQGEGANPTYIAESFGILVPDNAMKPCIAEFLPASRTAGFHPTMFQGYEIVFAIVGPLAIKFGDKCEVLETGDSVYLDAGTSRTYGAAADAVAKAMVISLPARDAQGVAPASRRPVPDSASRRQPSNF
ncbi:Transcriptional regulator, MerR family [Acidisarcina polymorpha]|uniref:Transcriptional regulator, MerR family n=1 Tax=Acidisarcina polymorpha TaxID=2211140 RepID=A0A2Z5G7S6_9BACT|nr:XRE family transcriptional regulator [Acidisarcina polymorpha]AXC14626.1 Transcriptional regulator, MerR family [Acidisarcina polymorpha]